MTYASIATIQHDPNVDVNAMRAAMTISRQWNSHLSVLCAGVDTVDPAYYYNGAQAIAIQQNLELANELSENLERAARNALRFHTASWDVEAVTTLTSGLAPYLKQCLRFHDLVVLPLPYGPKCSVIDIINLETSLLDAKIPVLAIPDGYKVTELPCKVLVGWDNGAAALAAARAALPFVAAAETTCIHMIDPPHHGVDRSDPGGKLAGLFARSGANVEITVTSRKEPNTGRQLLKRADEVGADLVVMGGYGNSRLKEAVLGGVTRTILHEAPLPVLLAH
jgi:nucleotide-binding universal stress UspA family protein